MGFDQYESVLHSFAAQLSGNLPVPILLRRMCQQLGVSSVRRAKLDTGRSLLVDVSTSPQIILNCTNSAFANQPAPFTRWERFLIAHELGHLVLHQAGAKRPSGAADYWTLETLCDAFARRLLIPDEYVNEVVNRSSRTAIGRLQSTLSLENQARVPWSVAAFRITDMIGDTAFFKVTEATDGGYKVVVSTMRKGFIRLVKPGSALCRSLNDIFDHTEGATEIESSKLLGLAKIPAIESGAAQVTKSEIRIAIRASKG